MRLHKQGEFELDLEALGGGTKAAHGQEQQRTLHTTHYTLHPTLYTLHTTHYPAPSVSIT